MAQLRKSSRLAQKADEPEAKRPKTEAAEDKPEDKSEDEAPKAKTEKDNGDSTPKPAKEKTKEIEVGDDVPDMTLPDENGDDVSLKAAAAKSKFVVIFAYPKASTPGCTKQARGFQLNRDKLQELDATVFGLLADSPKSQLNFVTKQSLKYTLLCDPKRELILVLGAKKSPSGIKRSHWIFKDGKLAVKRIQISPDVSVLSALEDIEKMAKE